MKRTFWGLAVGLFLALILTTVAGEKPLHILSVIFKGSFGSLDDLGLTLFYATSLIFTGLAVGVAMDAGLFNIGAEGQLTIATIFAAWTGIAFPHVHPYLAPLFALLVGLTAAGLWGFIPGALNVYRGSHEVIVTMMMNFVAAGLASYLTIEILKNPDSQNPETASVANQYLLRDFDFIANLAPNSPLNLSFLIALLIAILLFILKNKSTLFYKIKMVGLNPDASLAYQINAKQIRIIAMTLSGILAGFVCMNEVLGSAGKFRIGFSADYGFIGIAVALLARNHPIGIVFSAFFFAVLQKGTSDLDFETENITRDFSKVLQAVLIISLIVAHQVKFKFKGLKNGN